MAPGVEVDTIRTHNSALAEGGPNDLLDIVRAKEKLRSKRVPAHARPLTLRIVRETFEGWSLRCHDRPFGRCWEPAAESCPISVRMAPRCRSANLFRMIRHVREKHACPRCSRIVQASAPSRPIEQGLPSPRSRAHFLDSKYGHYFPLDEFVDLVTESVMMRDTILLLLDGHRGGIERPFASSYWVT
jgi:hypothetical protein